MRHRPSCPIGKDKVEMLTSRVTKHLGYPSVISETKISKGEIGLGIHRVGDDFFGPGVANGYLGFDQTRSGHEFIE